MPLLPSKPLVVATGACAAVGLVAPLIGLEPGLSLVAASTLLVFAAVDALVTRARMPFPEVKAAKTTRLSRDREGEFDVLVAHGPEPRTFRMGLSLGPTLALKEEEGRLEIPAGESWMRTRWICTPHARGYVNEAIVALEHRSLFSLWEVRNVRTIPVDIRIYPNLFAERRPLAAVFLARGRMGAQLQRTVGRGREFEKLRDYLPGDGFDEIHWKATAKRNRPITKVFQAERTQDITVVIDTSRLSGRTVTLDGKEMPLLERFLSATLLLLTAAERQGDRFGLVLFDERVRTFIPSGSGDSHFSACREAAARCQPSRLPPDVAELVRTLRTRIRRRSLLFILTDLSDPVVAEDFARHAPALAKQHVVLLSQIPPPEVARLYQGDALTQTEEVYAHLAGHERWLDLHATERLLRAAGVTASTIRHETVAEELIAQYLRARQRQLL